MSSEETWHVRCHRADYEWKGALEAVWEVSMDPISDDFTPDEVDAASLFDLWVDRLRKDGGGDLIPIYWFVACYSEGKFSLMPFQFNEDPDFVSENFLTDYTWPTNVRTGERLNWFELPVVDKLWNSDSADKGGFIQEATGWKPSVMQPYVYLPALIVARRAN